MCHDNVVLPECIMILMHFARSKPLGYLSIENHIPFMLVIQSTVFRSNRLFSHPPRLPTHHCVFFDSVGPCFASSPLNQSVVNLIPSSIPTVGS